MKKKKLPHFKSEDEVADFWATHDATEYEMHDTDTIFVLSPRLARQIRERAKRRMISIRLAEWEIQKSKDIAKKKGVPYQTLIREWIDAGIRAAHFEKSPRKAA